jgi:pimeloyl-ACP methyl ester carboxylesterase
MESFIEKYKSSQIHYCKSVSSDNKKPLLLCFQGYAEAAESFSFLEKYIADDFIIIAVDLPFHGQTEWNEKLNFTPQDFTGVIQSILNKFSLVDNKIYLLGFSMGGRTALAVFPLLINQTKKIILLAPDGLSMTAAYWFATQTFAGNKIFSIAMNKPEYFSIIMNVAKKIKLMNQSVYKFIHHFINNKEVRIQLYKRWTVLRKFTPDLKKIKALIAANKIPVKLVYGEYDQIIFIDGGKKFVKGIEQYCSLQMLPTGHQILQEKHIELIISLLKD